MLGTEIAVFARRLSRRALEVFFLGTAMSARKHTGLQVELAELRPPRVGIVGAAVVVEVVVQARST